MKISIIPNEKISLEELNSFEKTNNCILPSDYKKILLEYNGGNIVEKNRFNFITTYGKPSFFIPIKIMSLYEIERDKEDKEFLLIGSAVSGMNYIQSYISIYLSDKLNRYGKIYLYDIGGDIDLISNSFTEFINYKLID